MCGLVGIIEIDPLLPGEDIPSSEVIAEVVSAIEQRNVSQLYSGTIQAQEYAGGEGRLVGLEDYVQALKSYSNLVPVLRNLDTWKSLKELASRLDVFSSREESLLEKGSSLSSQVIESVNAALVRVRDITWALEKEVLAKRDPILALMGEDLFSAATDSVFREYHRIQIVLDAMDRLEVRGRDSLGLSCSLSPVDLNHLQKIEESWLSCGLAEESVRRRGLPDATNGSVLWNVSSGSPSITFLYKVASEIGRMGDNARVLREAISKDGLLRAALVHPGVSVRLMAHTRWASNGIINVPNCHPLDGRTLGDREESSGVVVAAMNGDIDNFDELRRIHEQETGRSIASTITTDAKVIPVLAERYLSQGVEPLEAFRRTVNDFEGSHAIALETDRSPGQVFLALRGSGQSIYVGLAEGRLIYASEVYGVVEETSSYLRMDGEALRDPSQPQSNGQILCIDVRQGSGLQAIRGIWYDGTPMTWTEEDLKTAEITTRDIDRSDFEHFFAKEISEAPRSVSKTLQGKFDVKRSGSKKEISFNLGEEILPNRVVEALRQGRIRRIVFIGQGTAAVAGQACSALVGRQLTGANVSVYGLKSSEFSGFALSPDMTDSLVIAVTQSGTTTDTNRAVDLAISRGAHTLAIVNRRGSDVTHKVDGVFYTSDGRDVEMSVASTKAFYSQVTAGAVLALQFARIFETMDMRDIAAGLEELRSLPAMLARIHADHGSINESAQALAPTQKHWAVVGSGPNFIAAQEIRIKLSELCYKSIACDVVEDKKHIDLSSEPLLLVCAAGSRESVLGDLVKDVAIFKAHKAQPIVIASEEETRFDPYAVHVLHIPRASESISLVLCTMAGHLWGYAAARALDKESQFFGHIRSELVARIWSGGVSQDLSRLLSDQELRGFLDLSYREFCRRKQERRYASSLESDTCANLALLFKYVQGKAPLSDFVVEFDRPPTYENVVDEFLNHLGRAIDDLSRPIDAIKHQAKTVTVGTSRPEGFPQGPLFDVLRELRVGVDQVGFRDVSMFRALQPSVHEVAGYTVYSVEGLDAFGRPHEESRIETLKKVGIAESMKSRADSGAPLVGNKRTIVMRRELYLGIGKSDQKRLLVLPLLDDRARVTRLLLVHLSFVEHLELGEKQSLLGSKLEEIRNAVEEANVVWKERYLEALSPEFLLTRSVDRIAETIFAIEGASPST